MDIGKLCGGAGAGWRRENMWKLGYISNTKNKFLEGHYMLK